MICGFTFAILATEAGLRLLGLNPFPIWPPRYLHRAAADVGLEPNPGFRGIQATKEFVVQITINSMGLRGPEIRDGKEQILIIGDSFAFGHGVEEEETLSRQLEARLEGPDGARPEVLNLGVMSYGTDQSVKRFRSIAPHTHAKSCALIFFAGNDVLENSRPDLTVKSGYVVTEDQAVSSLMLARQRIKESSSIYRLLANALYTPVVPGTCSTHSSFGFDTFKTMETEAVSEGWKATEQWLQNWKKDLDTHEMTGVVVCLPTRFQVDSSRWQSHVDRCRFDQSSYDLGRVQEKLRSICLRLDIPYHDALPAFSKGGRELYYEGFLEMHLTPKGQALLATETEAALRSAGALLGFR